MLQSETGPRRSRNPAATRRNILDAAMEEFSKNGLSGSRVDAIADRTCTTVRMIYYYFQNKEALFRAVLERSYGEMRAAESKLQLEELSPDLAIRRLVEFAFDHHEANPSFVRLVTIENIHFARHIVLSDTVRAMNQAVIDSIAAILERGREAGLFRADATPLGLHMLMTSFCFFRVANSHTLGAIFGENPLSQERRGTQRAMAVSSVLGYLSSQSPG